MFETLSKAAPDAILNLMKLYRDDPRSDKIDLGVGVYRDENGLTPVLASVREAELRLHQNQDSKAYVGLAGDMDFNTAMIDLVLADSVDKARLRAVQAPGGSGALYIVFGLLALARPVARLWLSDPTWPNHKPIARAAGLELRVYPYFDTRSKSVDFAAMASTLRGLGPDDIVLLHGCCHNPSGADLTPAQWDEITDIAVERGFLPLIDLAYLGFGDGLDEDAYGIRRLASKVPELAAALSCSKNFGLYRDRVGCAVLLAQNTEQADIAAGQLQSVARSTYSMPPDHGAAIVKIILQDPSLAARWRDELNTMRKRMLNLRQQLAAELKRKTNSTNFDFVAQHRGMFSRLGIAPQQVAELRQNHAIYMVDDSRINIAGLRESQVEQFADALLSVSQE